MFDSYLGSLLNISSVSIIKAIATALVAHFVLISAWRLWFHPLASVPGPRLAAVSSLWEVWQDVFRDGNMARAISRLHDEYNSDVVRISPNHVHINDPDFYFQMFKVTSGFEKDPAFYSKLGVPHSILSVDTKTARFIRTKANAIVAPRDWGVMAEKAYKVTKRASDHLASQSRRGDEIDLFQMLRSISTDMICHLCFGFSAGFVDNPEESSQLFRVLDMCLEGLWYTVHIPFLAEYIFVLPNWILKTLIPGYIYFRRQGGQWVDQTLERSKNASEEERKLTLIDVLNPSSGQDASEKDRSWLIDQGNVFVFAGVDTTSTMLMYTFHKVLSSPDILNRLQKELQDAKLSIDEQYDWKRVRQLPYLTAVIKEGLRMSVVIPGRLPRVVPPEGVKYKGLFIPGGTSVSSTIYSMHHNPAVFPEPYWFNPDRWLAEDSIELEKYNVAFSKGTRSCIGMNLAYLEIYTTLALFFSKFEMRVDYPGVGEELDWGDSLARRSKDFIKVSILADRFSDGV
ncbi:cytochrome P450 [Penicillium argentinense]|uniref:Cytochrome P450 n=1 Tax=Penicillium argentinense TaxID=1131581 RepID=A0A9W9EYE1_9EURO|nr:cytochrome P450 [Penicillium argentinense]KAJ5090176.1 cytochrome P450 [Penicillium argentinense]